MWSFYLALLLTVTAAQGAKIFPAVKLAGAGAFGQAEGGAQGAGLAGVAEPAEEAGVAEVAVGGAEEAAGQVRVDAEGRENQEEDVEKLEEEIVTLLSNGKFEPLNLPAGATLLLGHIDTTFSCGNNPYGYYADEKNGCSVFHICLPNLFEDGKVETLQYSFMCGENTKFDQKELACLGEAEALRCEDSSEYYHINEQFGLPEEKV